MATQKKIDTVSSLSEKLSRAKSLVFADYRGLKHKQMEELRKVLKKTEAEFVVAKNRLMLRALDLKRSHPARKGETFTEFLTDTTAILFSYADEVAPLRELVKFMKSAGFGKLKAGMVGEKILGEPDLVRLSTLPSRDVLLGRLVSQLNAPIQGLHYALQWNLRKLVYAFDAITNKKGQIQRS